MKNILYLDTTGSRLKIGVSRDETVLEKIMVCESHRYHSAMLIPAVQDLLREANLSIRELSGLAINHGPGSFTGIRTGIVTARTMGQFLGSDSDGLPVYVLNSFELVACRQSGPVAVYFDALRGRAYHAALTLTAEGPRYQAPPALLDLNDPSAHESALQVGPEAALWVTSGLESFFPGRQCSLITDELITPSAMHRLISQNPAYFKRSWHEVRPLYLQEPSITVKKPRLPVMDGL